MCRYKRLDRSNLRTYGQCWGLDWKRWTPEDEWLSRRESGAWVEAKVVGISPNNTSIKEDTTGKYMHNKGSRYNNYKLFMKIVVSTTLNSIMRPGRILWHSTIRPSLHAKSGRRWTSSHKASSLNPACPSPDWLLNAREMFLCKHASQEYIERRWCVAIDDISSRDATISFTKWHNHLCLPIITNDTQQE
jgi:hypothetical protein